MTPAGLVGYYGTVAAAGAVIEGGGFAVVRLGTSVLAESRRRDESVYSLRQIASRVAIAAGMLIASVGGLISTAGLLVSGIGVAALIGRVLRVYPYSRFASLLAYSGFVSGGFAGLMIARQVAAWAFQPLHPV